MSTDAGSKPAATLAAFSRDQAPRVNTALIDNVGVTIETYLSEASMTVAELNALQIGETITLEAALNQVVELRVNGVAIAHGELVAVGDQFGVRITAVST